MLIGGGKILWDLNDLQSRAVCSFLLEVVFKVCWSHCKLSIGLSVAGKPNLGLYHLYFMAVLLIFAMRWAIKVLWLMFEIPVNGA